MAIKNLNKIRFLYLFSPTLYVKCSDRKIHAMCHPAQPANTEAMQRYRSNTSRTLGARTCMDMYQMLARI